MRNNGFKGTLLELLEHCARLAPSPVQVDTHDTWILNQLSIQNNILPIRKYGNYSRCTEIPKGNIIYLATDNEPLAWLFKNASERQNSLRYLITSTNMPISWSVQNPPGFSHKYSGVSSDFRAAGMIIAHMENAGILQAIVNDEYKERFLRSLAFSNVFLFPAPRVFNVSCDNVPPGYQITARSVDSDPLVRSLAKSWLHDKLAKAGYPCRIALSPELVPDPNWLNLLRTITVTVTPKQGQAPAARNSRQVNSHQNNSVTNSCAIDKVDRSNAMTLDDVISYLRAWRQICPNAVQLDGSLTYTKNLKPWVYFKVSDYIDGPDDAPGGKPPVSFKGSEYNGTVHLNGDSRDVAIDQFIAAYDACDDYQQILRPSVTGRGNNKSLKLSGFVKAAGFYCYYD